MSDTGFPDVGTPGFAGTIKTQHCVAVEADPPPSLQKKMGAA